MSISLGGLHTLLAKFLFLYSRLSGCTGCTSSPAYTKWWYAGAGLVPLNCLDPLHDQSPAHVLSGRPDAWTSPFFKTSTSIPAPTPPGMANRTKRRHTADTPAIWAGMMLHMQKSADQWIVQVLLLLFLLQLHLSTKSR